MISLVLACADSDGQLHRPAGLHLLLCSSAVAVGQTAAALAKLPAAGYIRPMFSAEFSRNRPGLAGLFSFAILHHFPSLDRDLMCVGNGLYWFCKGL